MEYQFKEKEHLHQVKVSGEWKNLTGCTTILSVIAKPQLISWAANIAVDYICSHLRELLCEGDEKQKQILNEARNAHTKRKTDAGQKGKAIHAEIEQFIKNWIAFNKGEEYPPIKYSEQALKFIKWVSDNNVRFIASEKNIYSEKYFIGGIVDFICEIDGQIWIGDIKTSNSGIYPAHFWQCAGYDLMLQECMPELKVDGYLILNIKENGEFKEKRSISNEENIKAFLACCDIYRIQEKIKNQII